VERDRRLDLRSLAGVEHGPQLMDLPQVPPELSSYSPLRTQNRVAYQGS
jgi:hypothetical protein